MMQFSAITTPNAGHIAVIAVIAMMYDMTLKYLDDDANFVGGIAEKKLKI